MDHELVLDFYYSSGQSVELLPISRSDYRFQYIEDFFQSRWLHNDKETMRVVRILEVRQDAETMRPYKDYKSRFYGEDAKESFQLHGTNRQCMLGENDYEVTPCNSSLCYVCCILRDSFDVAQSGKKFGFKRFGYGIYLTPVSSKAHDYINNDLPDAHGSPKVLILARVALGRQLTATANMHYLQSPPEGYDSVIGRPGVHPDMNYEETVVYNNDAVRPSYLIVYETDTRKEEQYPETNYDYGQAQGSYINTGTYDSGEEVVNEVEQYPQTNYDDELVQQSYASDGNEVQEQYPQTSYGDGQVQKPYASDEDETNYDDGQVQGQYASDGEEVVDYNAGAGIYNDYEGTYQYQGDECQGDEWSEEQNADAGIKNDEETYRDQGDDCQGDTWDSDEEQDEEQEPETNSEYGQAPESDGSDSEVEVEVEIPVYEEHDPGMNYYYGYGPRPVQEPYASDSDEVEETYEEHYYYEVSGGWYY